jgi:hypothetical protein
MKRGLMIIGILIISILSTGVFASGEITECSFAGGCTIYEGETAGQRIIDKIYDITASEITTTNVEITAEGASQIMNEGDEKVFGDLKIKIRDIGFQAPIPSGRESDKDNESFLYISINPVEPFCFDSDANEEFPYGLNYYERGYILIGGLEGLSNVFYEIPETKMYPDRNGGKGGYVVESYCDENGFPAEIIFDCPYWVHEGSAECITEEESIDLLNNHENKIWGVRYADLIVNNTDINDTNEEDKDEEQNETEEDEEQNETEEDEEQNETSDEIICNGCSLENKCYPLGYRKSGKYCSDNNNNFLDYLEKKSNCENNFECKSNVCIDSECISGGLMKSIFNWFRRVFGRE